MSLSGDCFMDVLLIFTVLVLWLFTFITKKYSFWSNRNVFGPTPSFPWGTTGNIFSRNETILEHWNRMYKLITGKKLKFGGFFSFTNPILLMVDPELIKCVFVKDFDCFKDRGTFCNEEGEPLTANLVNLRGNKWKNLREKLTPTFSTGKLKGMYPILSGISKELDRLILERIDGDEDIDIKYILGRYTTDVIGTCAFGIDCNSLKDPTVPFYTNSKKVFERSFPQRLKILLSRTNPDLFKMLKLKSIDKDVAKFYTDVVREVIDVRKKNDIKRNDFMQILIGLMNQPDGISFNEVAAQAFVFFAAGYETSATASTFALYELAANPDIQEKVRNEIIVTKGNKDELTYEEIIAMPYLGKVVDETLRKYPPFPFTIRQCNTEYKIPNTEVTIQPKQVVLIPIMAIQRDPEYYSDPDDFDPERFSEPIKSSRHQFTYLPFGDGPRICIGMRFALLQVRVVLAALLSKYEFKVSSKTQEPLTFDEKNFSLSAKGKVWLRAEKLQTDLKI